MELLLPNTDSFVDQPATLQLISKELETAFHHEIQFNNWAQVCVFYSLQVHLPLVLVHLLSVLSKFPQVLPVTIHPGKKDRCQWESSLSIEVLSAVNLTTNIQVDFRYNATYDVQLLATVDENGHVVNSREVRDSLDPKNSFAVLLPPDVYSQLKINGSSFMIYGFQRALITDLQQFIPSNLKLLALGNFASLLFSKYTMKVIDVHEFKDVSLTDLK